MSRRIINFLIGVVFITTLFYTIFTVKQTLAIDCKNINLVFARGSSQNFPNLDNSDLNFPEWSIVDQSIIFRDKRKNTRDSNEPSFITSEAESAKFFKTIGDRILKDYPTLTMQFVSLHDFEGKFNQNGYRAVSAFGSLKTAYLSNNAVDARFGYSSIIADVTNDIYRRSVTDGAQELAGYLADEALRCPNQLVVLGGFSQGAQVVGEAMQILHNQGQDKLLSRLGHVDLFGDPKFNGYEITTNRLNPIQDRIMYPWVRGSAGSQYTGSLGPRKPYIPDVLTAQTTSWCDISDIVCGGIIALSDDPQAHGHVYKDSGGWIEKNGGETYVAIKQRLSLLAGLKDNSANSPYAYWPDIKKPNKIDVMFVMDATGDETLRLVPDDQYIADNFNIVSDTHLPEHYSSIHAGVITYTEFNKFTGNEDIVVPTVKNIVDLTPDIYSEFGEFRSLWGPEHFGGNNFGGVDLQDSPYSAINKALDQADWRSNARKVIMIFSNSWGKSVEPSTNFTEKIITARAKSKNIQILPVFTGATISENYGAGADPLIQSALTFWNSLAKNARGHATEVPNALAPHLIYDVIMSHTLMPDPVITIGKVYKDPSTKKAVKNIPADKKIVIKKGKKLKLSGNTSSSPKNKIKTFKWDFNGDGVFDEINDQPFVDHIFDEDFDGTIVLEVVDVNSDSQTTEQPIATTTDGSQTTITDSELLATPVVHTVRNKNDVVFSWGPTDGQLVFTNDEGAVQFVANASLGSFTLHNVPLGAFSLFVQLVNEADAGAVLQIDIPANNLGGQGGVSTTGAQSGTGQSSGGGLVLGVESAPNGTNTTGADTNSATILSSVHVQNLRVQPSGDPSLGNLNESDNSDTANSITAALGSFFKGLSESSGSRMHGFGANLVALFSYVLQDALVFLTLLFLLLLALLARDRRNRKYSASKRKRVIQKRTYTALAN